MKNGQFLQVEKRLWALAQHDCKLIHIMLLAQIQEFQRNKCDCYMTDKQFAENFGESERTVGRALKKLEEMNLIKRDTKFVTGYGRANRQRTLSVETKALNKLIGKPRKAEPIYEPVVTPVEEDTAEPAEIGYRPEQCVTFNRPMGCKPKNQKPKRQEIDISAMIDEI